MATEVSICSNALRKLGDSPITALTEDTERARLCNALYEPARDSLLRSHAWNFAITRAALAQISATPAFEYSYQYALPTDPFCLRVLKMEYDDYEFKIENLAGQGRVLLTNEGTANIIYIARITDPKLFDSIFVDTLTAKLASEMAYPITNSAALQKEMEKMYKLKLTEARSIDSTEGFTDDIISDTFTDFRKFQ
tara:strand:- start:611 stop:1195 length:585 start_codon:yes stop_codon:yes gene_type:complete